MDWRIDGHVIGFDRDWQYPAITEQHAYRMAVDFVDVFGPDVTYVGFPWATLIDVMRLDAPRAEPMLAALDQLRHLAPAGRRVTVAQHIFAGASEAIFRRAGIEEVYWSHQPALRLPAPRVGEGPGWKPFPLYPVAHRPRAGNKDRRWLYAFHGAIGDEHYLTDIRRRLVEALGADPRGSVRSYDGWHFQHIVYDVQIAGRPEDAGAVQREAERRADYLSMLEDSIFTLCPSGSGPNTIRLWEALGAGSIPVILSDSWAPPGGSARWRSAAIFLSEVDTELAGLADRLELLASQPALIDQFRARGAELWARYGPQTFISDILDDVALTRLAAADLWRL